MIYNIILGSIPIGVNPGGWEDRAPRFWNGGVVGGGCGRRGVSIKYYYIQEYENGTLSIVVPFQK